MSDNEEIEAPVRKTRSTRSARGAKTPKKSSAKPASRKTRGKKTTVAEVEVTDEELDQISDADQVDKMVTLQEDTILEASDNEGNVNVTKSQEDELLNSGDEAEKEKQNSNDAEDNPLSITNEVTMVEEGKNPVKCAEETEIEEETKQVDEEATVESRSPESEYKMNLDDIETSNDIETNENGLSDIIESEKMDTAEADNAENHVELKEDNSLGNEGIGKKIEEEMDSTEQSVPNTNGEPEAENISDDELPAPAPVKVPETEEVSDEELPGPKRAELPADTEVVSEDELPSSKKEGEEEETSSPKKESSKRKLSESGYDPTSPTSENDAPCKKSKEDKEEKEKEEVAKAKPKKLPELDKYWKAVNDDPTDFTGWTYLLQYVDQENDMEAAREAYDAFLSHYPYCYGYWRKYADYEKRKGNKKKCEEVFERGLKAIPLSVDLWIHYLTYVKSSRGEDEDFVRSQFERALAACGLEFRSDRLWDSYIKWETEGKRLQKVTALFDRLLATPTQGYTTHFDNFQEHVSSNPPNKVLDVDEFMALRKEVRSLLKSEEKAAENAELPPGDEDSKLYTTEEESKSIRERIVSIRRKVHKNTVNAVTARWNYEEGIKRPYFHVKPLERCQLKNWQDYLDYEIEQGDRTRIIVLFERCLIACALYEEFWLKFVNYLEGLKDPEYQAKIRDVYERACTIHHLKKPNLHLQWAAFEEMSDNINRAAEILVNLEKQVPNVLQVAYRRINLERRRGDFEKSTQLFEHYINNSKNKMISSNIAIKYSRFTFKIMKNYEKAHEILKSAIAKDPNPRLYLQLIDLILQKDEFNEDEIVSVFDEILAREGGEPDQKALFAQRKLEFLEDFGSSIEAVQAAYEQHQKLHKLVKDSNSKKKESKSEASSSSVSKKDGKSAASSQSQSYGNYQYSGSSASAPPYQYGTAGQQGQYNYTQYGQGGDQYQYQNWQPYQQGGYGGYNQWGGYTGDCAGSMKTVLECVDFTFSRV
ncbi:pre-mRNA-processing factor 39 isoform X2 [Anthonomus grandis grandis]|uniref:pre-mRNA-processing factor 39 isoform X2 n=1 Tax=Anthonomus grandis grandis TaxID=2921223 RepID=UPI0021650F41|nr:pre-mRNA-processing factor 39 isoform X2 [Anthonomus grandis grandis]